METGALFVGSRAACLEYLRSVDTNYVYILRRPDGRPFYVGEGIGARVFAHEHEARHPNDRRSNNHKLSVIRSIWRIGAMSYEIDSVDHDKASASAREAALIAGYRRLHEGGPLTNRHPGGGSAAGPAPASRTRHQATLGGTPQDNPERAILNRFVLAVAQMDSVVLKPLGQFRARPTKPYPNRSMGPTLRQAVALVASASANGIVIDGGCEVPRLATVEGVDGLIENGVSCDLATSHMAELLPAENPSAERFRLSPSQAHAVIGFVGRPKCIDLGVALPR